MRHFMILCTVLLLLCAISHVCVGAKEHGEGNGTRTSQVSGMSKTLGDKISYPKKVTSLKKRPTKTPTTTPTPATSASTTTATLSTAAKKSLTTKAKTKHAEAAQIAAAKLAENFKNLPADDLEFIKELDKQFKLHGDKIKIKVERDNSTNTKSNKRTIDGELGYGYSANGGYDYAPPKFMFYPYSQQDIPPPSDGSATYYSNYESSKTSVTSVTIEPSYSYELKPQTSYETTHPHDVQAQIDLPQQPASDEQQHSEEHDKQPIGTHGYEEPVIVLRIPGPTKYATHLQMLLQQYLEIRAAQYLRILEEADQRKQHHQHHHQQQLLDAEEPVPKHYEQAPPPAPAPIEYQAPPAAAAGAAAEHEEQHEYNQEVSYAHQLAPTPAPIQYPAIDDVYQSYKGRHQHHQEHLHQHQHQHTAEQSYQAPEAEQFYAPALPPAASYQDVETPHYYYMHATSPQQQQQQQQQHQQYHHTSQAYAADSDAPAAYQPQLYLIAMAPHTHPHPHSFPHPLPQSHVQYEETAEEPASPQYAHTQQPIYVADEAASDAAHELPLTENNPRHTHTKVVFTTHNSDAHADYTHSAYALPSIRPYERHAPASYHQQEQQQQNHHHHHHLHHHQHQQHQQQQQQQQQEQEQLQLQEQKEQEQEHEQQNHYQQVAAASSAEEISDAANEYQQSAGEHESSQSPYNYHAHAVHQPARPRRAGAKQATTAAAAAAVAAKATARSGTKTAATTSTTKATGTGSAKPVANGDTDHRLQQIREYVREKLGAEMSSAVEYKTTQLHKG